MFHMACTYNQPHCIICFQFEKHTHKCILFNPAPPAPAPAPVPAPEPKEDEGDENDEIDEGDERDKDEGEDEEAAEPYDVEQDEKEQEDTAEDLATTAEADEAEENGQADYKDWQGKKVQNTWREVLALEDARENAFLRHYAELSRRSTKKKVQETKEIKQTSPKRKRETEEPEPQHAPVAKKAKHSKKPSKKSSIPADNAPAPENLPTCSRGKTHGPVAINRTGPRKGLPGTLCKACAANNVQRNKKCMEFQASGNKD